ncbi:MAG TPA: PspC domain-containing protein, partial [Bacillota bacterium]|nr:PspC domain-containing protein [Bacillota bacterium]
MDLMETKGKLYKSQQDKALFGVCGGIAEYFNVDSLVVRLLFVLFTLVYGAGLLFYLVAALLIPSAPVSAGVRQTVQPVAEPSVENG